MKALPSLDVLQDYFRVERGNLIRNKSASWNTKEGDIAGTMKKGYLWAYVKGTGYAVHRIIWKLANGKDPYGLEIDHIDGDPLNNHPSNLRTVTKKDNLRNQKLRVNNTSGVVGVSPHKNGWLSQINGKGKWFKNFTDAVAHRAAREAELGFHINHGRI